MNLGGRALKKWIMLLLMTGLMFCIVISSQAASELAVPQFTSAKVSTGTIELEWEKVSGISGYEIYGKSAVDEDYVRISTLDKKHTSLSITDQFPCDYYFAIRAYRKRWWKTSYSEFSNVITVQLRGIDIELKNLVLDYSLEDNLYALSSAIGNMSESITREYPNGYYEGNNMVLGVNLDASYPEYPNLLYIENTGNKRISLEGVRIGMTLDKAREIFINEGFYSDGNDTTTFWAGNAGCIELEVNKDRVSGYSYVCAYTG